MGETGTDITPTAFPACWHERNPRAELGKILGAFISPEERCTAARKLKPEAVALVPLALSVSRVLPQTPAVNPPQRIYFVASLSGLPKAQGEPYQGHEVHRPVLC